ncbi:uncharacterized protein LOC114732634 [Neltuma alba]|uniref:uncharacterized protein LOC114732634 n=1 Tax=Neltuma alba TaxID=207710 RepID=UPI0010A45DEF|nr:uncharacterized protein LOC114732634 [Prosopis alba]
MKRRLADIVNVPEEAKKWMVSDLIIDGRWNMSNLQPLISVEILQKICSIGSDHFQRRDKLIWDKTRNGLYVVKKGYVEARSRRNVIDGRAGSSFSLPYDIWNKVWKLRVLPKIKNFMWRCLVGAVPVNEALVRRRCRTSELCLIKQQGSFGEQKGGR